MATLVACLVLVLILDHGRGIWVDEATSLWLARHDIGFAQALRERWITDVHPPLFSVYAWMFEPLLGGSVRAMRLINLSGLIIAGLVWRGAWRAGIDRDFLALFAVLVASSPFAILYAAEFRSYFLQLLLAACLIVQLRRIDEGRGGWGLLALVSLLLINLHYYGSLVGLILLAAEAIRLWRAKRTRDAARLLLIMAITIVPLTASMAAMLAAITPVKVTHTGTIKALLSIGAVMGSALLPNLIATGAIVLFRPRPAKRGFLLMLIAAGASVALAFFLLNLINHNLVARHLIAAAPILAAIAALLLVDMVRERRWLFPAICANALLLAICATGYGLINQRWESNVAAIDRARAGCAAPVYALNTLVLLDRDDPQLSVPAIDDYFAFTYRVIAKEAGWAVTVLPDGRPIRPVGDCPSLLWIEHHYARRDASDVELARIAGFVGPIKVARLQRGDARALLEIRATN